MNFADSTILITGASRGLGRALARHFADRCRHIVVTGRSEQTLAHTVEDVRGQAGSCTPIVSDLRSQPDLERIRDSLQDAGAQLDVLIHNAADVTSKPFADTSPEEIESLIQTNVIGPLQLTRLLLPLMNESEARRIVWISSLAGYKPNPTQTVYSISKFAVNGAALALRTDLGPQAYSILNVPLSSIEFGAESRSGTVLATRACEKIERAIARKQRELFLSPVSRALMRFYGLFPRAMDG